METITGSPRLILNAECHNTKTSLGYPIMNATSIRSEISLSEISFLQPSKTTDLNLSHASVLRRKLIPFSLPMSRSEAETGVENMENKIKTHNRIKFIRIIFQLQKECRFGEEFLLVGDDHILGSWNPSRAKPLSWSENHIWTTDLQIPIGKAIQYKFLLRTEKGEILWQPGPDRVFRSWEAPTNMLIIKEDWENAEAQQICDREITNIHKDQENADHKPSGFFDF